VINLADYVHERAADTAKKIRRALKQAFPELPARHFKVRSSTYTGGSSIDVRWTDFPVKEEVESIIQRYKSANFDGMQDLETTHGYIDPEDGKRYIGAKYIFAHYDISDERKEKIIEYMEDKYEDFDRSQLYNMQWTRTYNETAGFFDVNNNLHPMHDRELFNMDKVPMQEDTKDYTPVAIRAIEEAIEKTDLFLYGMWPLEASMIGDIKKYKASDVITNVLKSVEETVLNDVLTDENIERVKRHYYYSDTQHEFDEQLPGIVRQDVITSMQTRVSKSLEKKIKDEYKAVWGEIYKEFRVVKGLTTGDVMKEIVKYAFPKGEGQYDEIKENLDFNAYSLEEELIKFKKEKIQEYNRRLEDEKNAKKQNVNKQETSNQEEKEENKATGNKEKRNTSLTEKEITDMARIMQESAKEHGIDPKEMTKAFTVQEAQKWKENFPDDFTSLVKDRLHAYAIAYKARGKENNASKPNTSKAKTKDTGRRGKMFHIKVKDIETNKEFKAQGIFQSKEEAIKEMSEVYAQEMGTTEDNILVKAWGRGEKEGIYPGEVEQNKKPSSSTGWKHKKDENLIYKETRLQQGHVGLVVMDLKEKFIQVYHGITFNKHNAVPATESRRFRLCGGGYNEVNEVFSPWLIPTDLSELESLVAKYGKKREENKEQGKDESSEKENKETNETQYMKSPVWKVTYNSKEEMLQEVMQALLQGEVNILFTKANGTKRFMRGTRNIEHFKDNGSLVEQFNELNTENNIGKEINSGTVSIVDLDVEGGAGGRKFVAERLISFQSNIKGGPVKGISYKRRDGDDEAGKHVNPNSFPTKDMIDILNNKVVRLVFKKKDGSTRPMVATRNPNIVELYTELDKNGKRPKSRTDNNTQEAVQAQIDKDYVTVLDLEKGAFRTFKPSTLMDYDVDNGISSWMEFAPNNDAWFNIARNGQDPKQYYKEGKRAAENIGRTLGERTNYEQKRNMENRNEQKTQEDMNKALEHAQTRKEETRVKRERRVKVKELVHKSAIEFAKIPGNERVENIYGEIKGIADKLRKNKAFNNMECRIQQAVNFDDKKLTAIQVNGDDVIYLHPTFVVNAFSGRVYLDRTPNKDFSSIGKQFNSDADTGSEDVLDVLVKKISGTRRMKSDLYRTDAQTEKRTKRLLALAGQRRERYATQGMDFTVAKSHDGVTPVLGVTFNNKHYTVHPDAVIQLQGEQRREMFRCRNQNARLTELSTFFAKWIKHTQDETEKAHINSLAELVLTGIDLRKKVT